jgi:hypothetical protein
MERVATACAIWQTTTGIKVTIMGPTKKVSCGQQFANDPLKNSCLKLRNN